MRRKCLDYLLDSIFWFLIMLLPLIYYFLASKWNIEFALFPSLESLNMDINIVKTNFIANIFSQIGSQYLKVTLQPFIYWYLSYCVWVLIIHVLFDFVAFIPRISHQLLNKFYNLGGLKE